jgi:predicted esterase
LTGALIGPPGTAWPSSPDLLTGVPVLLTGSDTDEWITEEQTRHTAGVLARLGADVRMRIYKGRPHIVSEPELVEARELLREMTG